MRFLSLLSKYSAHREIGDWVFSLVPHVWYDYLLCEVPGYDN